MKRAVLGAIATLLISAAAYAQTNYAPPSIDAYSEVVARPLFTPTRRPPAHVVAASGSAAPVNLVGIVIAPDQKLAMIKETPTGPVRYVPEGTRLAAGMVTMIAADQIALRTADGSVAQIKLFAPIGPSLAGQTQQAAIPAPAVAPVTAQAAPDAVDNTIPAPASGEAVPEGLMAAIPAHTSKPPSGTTGGSGMR